MVHPQGLCVCTRVHVNIIISLKNVSLDRIRAGWVEELEILDETWHIALK